jgi:trimethylamine---corrinoid protein Co-methyltransferase
MITGNLNLFDEANLDRLHAAVLDILERTGIQVHHDTFLDALDGMGARVDKAGRAVRFPKPFVETFLEERRQAAASAAPQTRNHDAPYAPSVGCVIAPFLHDYAARQRRPGTRQDLVDIIRWAEADTPPECRVGQAVTMGEVDARVEPIEAYALLIEHSSRPNETAYMSDEAQIEFLLDLTEACHGKRLHPHGASFMTSPLTFGDRVARHVLARIRFGCDHFGMGVMPICGGNSPMTVAGNVALSAAEIIGGWLTIRSLQPEGTFGGGACNGTVDMRRGAAVFNSPEAMLANLGVAELFERRFGGGVGVAAGPDYIDARVPGIQAAHERTCRAMAVAAFTGRPFHFGGTGTLDGGKIFSPVQFILERDLGEGLWRFGQGIQVNDDTLAVDTIDAVGVGEGKSYLDAEHTLMHFRDTWFPQFISRNPWANDETEFGCDARMLDAAHQHYLDAITRDEPPDRDEDTLREVRKIVERARRHLLDA